MDLVAQTVVDPMFRQGRHTTSCEGVNSVIKC